MEHQLETNVPDKKPQLEKWHVLFRASIRENSIENWAFF